LCIIGCTLLNSTTASSLMSTETSGATSITDGTILTNQSLIRHGTNSLRATYIQVWDVNAGTNTFTAKYRTTAGTATFADRILQVIPL
jgi:hypothetical protein